MVIASVLFEGATMGVLVTWIFFLIAWDIYVLSFGGMDSTISFRVRAWIKLNPVIAFAIGFVCGHLFWE